MTDFSEPTEPVSLRPHLNTLEKIVLIGETAVFSSLAFARILYDSGCSYIVNHVNQMGYYIQNGFAHGATALWSFTAAGLLSRGVARRISERYHELIQLTAGLFAAELSQFGIEAIQAISNHGLQRDVLTDMSQGLLYALPFIALTVGCYAYSRHVRHRTYTQTAPTD